MIFRYLIWHLCGVSSKWNLGLANYVLDAGFKQPCIFIVSSIQLLSSIGFQFNLHVTVFWSSVDIPSKVFTGGILKNLTLFMLKQLLKNNKKDSKLNQYISFHTLWHVWWGFRHGLWHGVSLDQWKFHGLCLIITPEF